MNKFSGNVVVRAEAQNPVELQLVDNGDIQSLVGVTEILLILTEKIKTGTPQEITFTLTTDANFIILDDENGIIQLIPETTDFVNKRIFAFKCLITDAAGNVSAFPKGFNYLWEVFK